MRERTTVRMGLVLALLAGALATTDAPAATGDLPPAKEMPSPARAGPGRGGGAGAPCASGIGIRQSGDGGRTWSAPLTPHRDGTATEHGFVSLAAESGDLAAVWLDGRKTAGHDEGAPGPGPDMT